MFWKKFGIKKNSVTGITGSGGKTSLMFCLAEELSKQGKVLVTTTTKIYEPDENIYEELFLTENKKSFKGKGKNIFVLGLKIENGKLISPREEDILKIKSQYDDILYEGDGSKQKFMKFWREDEPCLLSFTDTVIGVGNIKSLELPFNEENVHRYNVYMDKNNKFYEKKYINFEILKSYLKEGKFFRNFEGKKIIFLNGVENFEEIKTALKFQKEVKNFMFGSVKKNKMYMDNNISAVVMGSGKSERFGKNKLLERIDGVPIIEILLRKLEELPFKNIFVTYKDKEIFEICRKYKVIPLENKKYFLGQSESIKLGAENIKDENIMFFTGDMPFLKEETIFKIISEFDGRITIPAVNGKRCSPVIFPNRYKEELLSLSGDVGGREIIKKENNLNFIEFFDKKQFMDIDREEDLKAVIKNDGK